jgi:ADP-ribose pyrophosphatase
MTGAAAGGLSSEVVTLFLASGLKRVHKGGGVAGENITVHEVPLSRADKWLASKAKAGLLVDPKIYGALYFIEKSAKSLRSRTTRER